MLLLLLNTTYFLYFIIYIYTVLKQSLCINILNSQNIKHMLGNIFANGNEQFHRKLMFSGDIELNPGSAFL